MSQQLPLDTVVVLLPVGFKTRWAELERERRTSVVITDVTVTVWHVIVTVEGKRELVGGRRQGDAAAAEQVWAQLCVWRS